MKKFEFTSPEGKKYEVTAPDSATEDQAFAVLQSQLKVAPTPRRETTVGEDIQNFGVGLASGAARIGRGLASAPKLVGLPPIGGQKWIDESRQAWDQVMKGRELSGTDPEGKQDRGFAGSAGEFTAELAGTAGVPGGKAVKYLPRALRWMKGKTGAAAAEGAAAGVMTGEGEWSDAGLGAGGGVVGQKLVQGVGRVLRGAKQTPQAEELRKMGIDVTAGQGSTGVIHALEEASQYLPVAANAVRRQRARPYDQFRGKVAESFQPDQFPMTARGPKTQPRGANMDEMIVNAEGDINKHLSGALDNKGRAFIEDEPFRADMSELFLRPTHVVGDSEASSVARYVNDQLNPGRREGQWSGRHLAQIRDNVLRQAESTSKPEVSRMLHDVAEKIEQMLYRQSPEYQIINESMRRPKANLRTAKDAASGAVAQGQFGVAQLAAAAERTNNPELRELARKAATVLEDDLKRGGTGVRTAIGVAALASGYGLGGPWGASTTAAVPAALYLGLGTRRGQRVVSGQLKAQKKLAEILRKHPTAGATVGGLSADELGD